MNKHVRNVFVRIKKKKKNDLLIYDAESRFPQRQSNPIWIFWKIPENIDELRVLRLKMKTQSNWILLLLLSLPGLAFGFYSALLNQGITVGYTTAKTCTEKGGGAANHD